MGHSPGKTIGAGRRRYTIGICGSFLLHASVIYTAASSSPEKESAGDEVQFVELSITSTVMPEPRVSQSTVETLPPTVPPMSDDNPPDTRRLRTAKKIHEHRRNLTSSTPLDAELSGETESIVPPSEIALNKINASQAGPPVPTKDFGADVPVSRQDPAGEVTRPPANPLPFDRRIPILFPSNRREHSATENEDMSASAVRDREQATPKSVRGELGIPEPGSGQGEFDFYSPFDYGKEMAKARKKNESDKMTFNLHKNTDKGFGVVCNTGSGWFMCTESGIARCNEKHQNLCRFAEKQEFEKLSEASFF